MMQIVVRAIHATKKLLRFISFRLAAVMLAILIALAVAEIFLRFAKFDLRFLSQLLYYQTYQLHLHEEDPDDEILFRLKPGSRDNITSINEFGERGPDNRIFSKAQSDFLIAVYGGSNAYGAGIKNNETWPALLEQELRDRLDKKVEVWNFGTSSYVPSQMVSLARRHMDSVKPDMVLLAFSNQGWKAMLGETNAVKRLSNPNLIEYYLSGVFMEHPSGEPYHPVVMALTKYCAFFRQVFLSTKVLWMEQRPTSSEYHHKYNVASVRRFASDYVGKIRIVAFVCPATGPESFGEYTSQPPIPTLILKANDKPARFRDIHPPKDVTAWYAKCLADWLVSENLISTLP